MENNENEMQAEQKISSEVEDRAVQAIVNKPEEKDESRKSFFMGIFSGVVIMLFVSMVTICAMGIYHNYQERKTSEKIQQQVSEASKQDDGSVLDDKATIEKVMLLENIIDQYYIEDIDNEQLAKGLYDGIMSSLDDPYAVYYDEEALKKLNEDTQGVYYGIGAYLQFDTELLYPRVTGIISGAPAEEVDIMVDDYIYEVDGVDVYNMDLSEAVALVKGPEGTTVKLTMFRKSLGKTFEVEVERRKVETPTVEYRMLDDNIAYIQIKEFDAVTLEQFEVALALMQHNGMKGLVLDLRGNPGGSLATVVDIANYFLPKGIVVYTEDKYGKREEYKCDGKNEIDVPLVVLVNGGSASASEILSGAIKDYKKGIILGTTTYGKGVVQRVLALPDGTAVKLTVSHYYTPLGNDIHKVGIEPDEELEIDAERFLEDGYDNQLERAQEIIREQIK